MRADPSSPDLRHDTFNYFNLDGTDVVWEVAVTSGAYYVTVVAGDPQVTNNANYRIAVEGVLAIDEVPTDSNRWCTGTVNVVVLDGRLTISSATGAVSNVVCYVDIWSAGGAYALDASNPNPPRKVAPPDVSYSFGYDGQGNLTSDDRYSYEWDSFNRIVKVTDTLYDASVDFKPIPKQVEYLYDALGRRVARLYSGHSVATNWASERCVYDGVTLLEERAYGSGELERRYFYDEAINRPVVVQEDKDNDGEVDGADDQAYVILADDRGTVLGVADKYGTVLEKLHYNTTGLAKSYSNDNTSATLDIYGNPIYRSQYVRFGFAGMYREPFTGKYHTQFRDYDPLHCKWLSRDPIAEAGGVNLTGYGGNNPLGGVDDLGLATQDFDIDFDLQSGLVKVVTRECPWWRARMDLSAWTDVPGTVRWRKPTTTEEAYWRKYKGGDPIGARLSYLAGAGIEQGYKDLVRLEFSIVVGTATAPFGGGSILVPAFMSSLAGSAAYEVGGLPMGDKIDPDRFAKSALFGTAGGVVIGKLLSPATRLLPKFSPKTYQVGEAMANGQLAGVGPGAAMRNGPEFAATTIGQRSHVVYQGVEKATGVVRYVGITERGVVTRSAEHVASANGKEKLVYSAIEGAKNLTKQQARIWEQRLINQYGLGKNGGQLLNKINSISRKYWAKWGIAQ